MTTDKTILDSAIQFEKAGIKLYTELQQAATDPVAIRLFETLIEQEKDHVSAIEKYANTHLFVSTYYVPLKDTIKEVFEELSDKTAIDSLSQKEGLESAIKLEDNGYNLYKDALANATDENDKSFYKFLMDMEKEHYESLANLYMYLYDHNMWLGKNESQSWDWMQQEFQIS